MRICGGVIPAQDYDFLLKNGASAIFGPGTVIPQSTKRILELLPERCEALEFYEITSNFSKCGLPKPVRIFHLPKQSFFETLFCHTYLQGILILSFMLFHSIELHKILDRRYQLILCGMHGISSIESTTL